MKSTRILTLTTLFSLLFGQSKGGVQEVSNEIGTDTISLIKDRGFRNGLSLKGTNSTISQAGKTLYPFKKGSDSAIWELAEWESKYQLSQNLLVRKGKASIYGNRGKMISFQKDGGDFLVRMEVTASEEYASPRKPGQGWPHLLLEQSFPEKVRLGELKGLLLDFSGRLASSEMKMQADQFVEGLHSAQFQLFITIQDLNPNSPGYRDYLWFGTPFYDYRHREADVYAAKDGGKDDATGKFIYSLASRDFMSGSFHDKAWITVRKDLYPEIKKAVTMARERGYLKQSADSDLTISGMNIGWEVPGTFDVEFEFKGFDIRAIR